MKLPNVVKSLRGVNETPIVTIKTNTNFPVDSDNLWPALLVDGENLQVEISMKSLTHLGGTTAAMLGSVSFNLSEEGLFKSVGFGQREFIPLATLLAWCRIGGRHYAELDSKIDPALRGYAEAGPDQYARTYLGHLVKFEHDLRTKLDELGYLCYESAYFDGPIQTGMCIYEFRKKPQNDLDRDAG